MFTFLCVVLLSLGVVFSRFICAVAFNKGFQFPPKQSGSVVVDLKVILWLHCYSCLSVREKSIAVHVIFSGLIFT